MRHLHERRQQLGQYMVLCERLLASCAHGSFCRVQLPRTLRRPILGPTEGLADGPSLPAQATVGEHPDRPGGAFVACRHALELSPPNLS